MSASRVSNMLSAVKNASMAKRNFVDIPYSSLCERIALVMKENGFLSEVKIYKQKDKDYKRLQLSVPIFKITDVRIVSKSGRRIYKSGIELKKIAGGFGISIVSTNRGILTGKEARKRKLGGEVICEIW